ncbi:MAG: hypothetical protein HYT08_04580 [Candidatus Levybacteria bacterium]|nr:hypothetical protein [Candidatus Levybacteria bacterium]
MACVALAAICGFFALMPSQHLTPQARASPEVSLASSSQATIVNLDVSQGILHPFTSGQGLDDSIRNSADIADNTAASCGSHDCTDIGAMSMAHSPLTNDVGLDSSITGSSRDSPVTTIPQTPTSLRDSWIVSSITGDVVDILRYAQSLQLTIIAAVVLGTALTYGLHRRCGKAGVFFSDRLAGTSAASS